MRHATARVTILLMWLFVLVVLALILVPGDPQSDPPYLLLIPAFLALSLILRAVVPRGRRRL